MCNNKQFNCFHYLATLLIKLRKEILELEVNLNHKILQFSLLNLKVIKKFEEDRYKEASHAKQVTPFN